MLARGDDVTGEDYKNRLESAKKEQEVKHLADYVIDATKSKEEVFQEVKEIIESEM
jgi:dephospho-CoA kinase